MKNILIGIDFHEDTDNLIDKTYQLIKPHGAKIWLLHVISISAEMVNFEMGYGFIRDYRADELNLENEILNDYVDKLKKRGINAEGLLVQGPTIDTILDESQKLSIDMIVFGHHTHSFMYNLFFGSTSTDIIKKSDIPVLVIPLKGK